MSRTNSYTGGYTGTITSYTTPVESYYPTIMLLYNMGFPDVRQMKPKTWKEKLMKVNINGKV